MKKVNLLICFILIAHISFAQKVTFNINGNNFTILKTEKENTVIAEYRMDWIQISAALSSMNKTGRFNSFGIEIVGKKVDNYPVGCCDKQNYNEPYKNNVTANWYNHSGLQQNISANQGDIENNMGEITITKIIGNVISGKFSVNIGGFKIQGIFEDIPVKNFSTP